MYARDPKQGGTGSICGEVYKQVAEKAYILHTKQKDSIVASNWSLATAQKPYLPSQSIDTTSDSTLPALSGWSIDEALFYLENWGIKVNRKGYGRIKSQSIKPGTPIEEISQITLICENL